MANPAATQPASGAKKKNKSHLRANASSFGLEKRSQPQGKDVTAYLMQQKSSFQGPQTTINYQRAVMQGHAQLAASGSKAAGGAMPSASAAMNATKGSLASSKRRQQQT